MPPVPQDREGVPMYPATHVPTAFCPMAVWGQLALLYVTAVQTVTGQASEKYAQPLEHVPKAGPPGI